MNEFPVDMVWNYSVIKGNSLKDIEAIVRTFHPSVRVIIKALAPYYPGGILRWQSLTIGTMPVVQFAGMIDFSKMILPRGTEAVAIKWRATTSRMHHESKSVLKVS